MNDFGKLLTAVITPFDSNGVLSTDTLWRLCKKLVHEKSDGLVLSGTTGESPNLTKEDRKIIYSTAKDSVGDKAKIIAGTGTYSTKESIEYTKMAIDLGVDGIMIVTPYYSKPSQLGILKHFESISENTELPIMAYNIPGRTATLIEHATLEKLVDDIGIHSIKDAVGDLEFSKIELETLKDKVHIYSGNDAETIEFMKMGGKGVVSVASHIVGKEIHQLIEFVNADELEAAEQIQNKLPNVGISTDIIVGFPGETNSDFEQTLEVMNSIKFDFAFNFKYSARRGTKAIEYDDQINEEDKKSRLARVITLQKEHTLFRNKKLIGSYQKVLIEKESKLSSSNWAGRTDSNKWVIFDKGKSKIGELVNVKVNEAVGVTLKGQINYNA